MVNRQTRRFFADEAKKAEKPSTKVHDQAVPPPPPPKAEGGSGSGFWIILTAALAGAGYYYKDEIYTYLGWNETKGGEVDMSAVKKEVVKAEETLKAVEKKSMEASASASPAKPIEAPSPVPTKPAAVQGAEKAGVKPTPVSESGPVDWKLVRNAIVELLDDPKYDDGSYGPVFVRLAWHSAGTYDKNTKLGGSEGAGMRFEAEGSWGANAGLNIARARLEPVKQKFPQVSYADLWSYAGTVAIEEMGGPDMKWRPGRKDFDSGTVVLPGGLLPDADGRQYLSEPAKHVREIFNRMGFNDQEMVCLIGAHALGRCHEDRSGYWGPWTRAPTTFSNQYFVVLLDEKWTVKTTHKGAPWKGPLQYEDASGELMMLPADYCLVQDPKFKKYVEMYAKDEEKFFKDFSKAWMKLQENGVKKFNGWRRYIFFGPRE